MNTTQLLASVKRGAMVPVNQETLSDADILAFCDEEIQTRFVPMITSLRQEYFVRSDDTSLVAARDYYAIPSRAVGRTIRHIIYKKSASEERSLQFIGIDKKRDYAGQTGDPSAFYIKGDEIIICPVPSASSGTLEIWSEFPPSALVTVASACAVTAIDRTLGTVTVDAVPSGLITGVLVDFVAAKPGHALLGYDLTVSNIAGTIITVGASNVPAKLIVGDWVSLAGYAPVVMLPTELHHSLCQAAQSRCLEALGDFEGMTASDAKLMQKMEAAKNILNPRVESKNLKVKRSGLLTSGRTMRIWSA